MNKLNGDTARIWLWMMKEGGRHTPIQVAHACELMDTAAANSLLRSMTECGSVMRWQTEGVKGFRYGVTPSCRIPLGLTVRDVMDAAMAEVE